MLLWNCFIVWAQKFLSYVSFVTKPTAKFSSQGYNLGKASYLWIVDVRLWQIQYYTWFLILYSVSLSGSNTYSIVGIGKKSVGGNLIIPLDI